ncbi:hypothetical protein X971_1778 [Agrobacterium tumefaciens LBA4213 (Ach5)]|jgi:hypothetical protein|nr:hypothetical protein X971_1778 [Agrobacterium tumefaciens LBA4213 (Ach5)]
MHSADVISSRWTLDAMMITPFWAGDNDHLIAPPSFSHLSTAGLPDFWVD